MKVVYEVTDWADSNVNHVYHMNDSMTKIYAYARWGNPADTQTFSKPIQIDSRGRKFEVVRNIYGWQDPDAVSTDRWEVMGSKGDRYVVERTENGLTCSCSGFRFRGACRHIQEQNSQ